MGGPKGRLIEGQGPTHQLAPLDEYEEEDVDVLQGGETRRGRD